MRPNLRITSLVPSEDDFRRREVPYSTSSKFPEPTSEFLVGPGHDASGTRAALGTGVGCAFADPVLLILHHQDHHQGVGGLHDTYSATLSQSELSVFPPVAEKGRRRLTLSHCAGQRSGAQRLSALPKGFWDRCRMFWAIPKLELPPLMPPLLLEGWGAWCFGIRGCVTKCNQVGWSLLSIRWTIAI